MKKTVSAGISSALLIFNAHAGFIDSSNDNDYSLSLSGNQYSNSYDAGLKIWTWGHDPVWHWDNVSMHIDGATGNANVSGQMLLTSTVSEYHGNNWSFNLDLTGIVTTPAWQGDGGGFTNREFTELLSGNDTSEYERDQLHIGWTGANLSLFNEYGDHWLSLDGKYNRNEVAAELAYNWDTGKLEFGAWYHHPKWCLEGDTLVTASYVDPEGPAVDVPEPATLALIGIGAVGLISLRKRKT